jgi:glycosyltransferase involved in cell wall biosynthesis
MSYSNKTVLSYVQSELMEREINVPTTAPQAAAPRQHPQILDTERIRVAVVCDLREENWPSMELVADSLLEGLSARHGSEIAATRIRPSMRRRLTRSNTYGGKLFNADRLFNRFRDYPRALRSMSSNFDIFHLVDHSYAQLTHELPPERTIVTCHDLDTFRCLLEPNNERRSPLFRAMMVRVLSGMQRAARVTCDSTATRDAILAYELLPPNRLALIQNGVHRAFSRKPNENQDVDRLLGASDEARLELLHVGSTIPRKRVDVLLELFAKVLVSFPHARLLRAGGEFTSEQRAHAAKLNILDSVVVLPHLSPEALAAVYRRAALVLLTSEREGFGLPIVEALACGTPTVASDISVLREVGGEASTYCPVGDVDAWVAAVGRLLRERENQPALWTIRQDVGAAHVSQFTWREYVEKTTALYREVALSCS